MIVHKIYRGGVAPKHTDLTAVNDSGPKWESLPGPNRIKVGSQAELDAMINHIKCPVGTFVSFDGASVHSLACVHVVVGIEPDFDKVDKRFGGVTANPFRVVQCDKWSPTSTEWVRWDDLVHMRPVTEKEWKNYVEPKLDYIQDRCKPFFPKDFTLSRSFVHPHAV